MKKRKLQEAIPRYQEYNQMSKEDTQKEYAQGRESRVPRTTPTYTENTRQVHRLDDIIPEQVRAKITQASIYEVFVQKKRRRESRGQNFRRRDDYA